MRQELPLSPKVASSEATAAVAGPSTGGRHGNQAGGNGTAHATSGRYLHRYLYDRRTEPSPRVDISSHGGSGRCLTTVAPAKLFVIDYDRRKEFSWQIRTPET